MTAREKVQELEERVKKLEKNPAPMSFTKKVQIVTFLIVVAILIVCSILAFWDDTGVSTTYISVIGGAAIGALISITIAITHKSEKENTKGGITYDLALQQHQYKGDE